MATEYTQKEPTKSGWGSQPWGSKGDKEFIRGWGGVKTEYKEKNDD